MEAIEY